MRPEENRYPGHFSYHKRLRYRISQFRSVLRATPLPDSELSLAQSVLTEPQMALFVRLHPSEQEHGLRVLQALRNQGEANLDLLAAALLHDVGKVCHPLQPWERVLIVLAKKLVPRQVVHWGDGEPKGWKRPFVISSKHPEWGAQLVSKTGASPLLLALIREHERKPLKENQEGLKDQLLAALQEVDDWN